MNKCWLLFKIQLWGLFNINRIFHANNKKERRNTLLVGICFAFVGSILLLYSGFIAFGFIQMGLVQMIPLFILIVCVLFTLIFTFLKTNSLLFGLKDYDMIMSLPVNSAIVITSRLCILYFMALVISILIMAPSIVLYGIDTNADVSIWIMMAVSIFIVPLLPMVLAMILGAVITAISVRVQFRTAFTVVMSMVIIFAIFGLSSQMQFMDETQLELAGTLVIEYLNKLYPPAILFTEAIRNGDWVRFFAFTVLSIGGLVVFVWLLSLYYEKIISLLLNDRTKSNYQVGRIKTSSPFIALYKKELRCLCSSSVYVLNCCIGAVMLLGASVAFLFLDEATIDQFMKFPGMIPFVIAMFVVMCSTTSASMSMEGKNRWIPISCPVDSMTIFSTKIAVNLTILLPSIIVSATLFAVRLEANLSEGVFIFLIPILYAFLISMTGLLLNLRFPKYDWTTEYSAIKQSVSVMLAILSGMVSVFLPILLVVVFPALKTLFLIATVLIITGVLVMLWGRLKRVTLYM